LKTLGERKKFLERFESKDIADLYLYFDYDTDKQKELCRSVALNVFKSFVKHLNFYESEVARSCLKEWKD